MSVWLPSLTMGIGRGRQQELLTAMEKLGAEEKRKLRNDTIEECARVAMDYYKTEIASCYGAEIAAAIRTLKEKS